MLAGHSGWAMVRAPGIAFFSLSRSPTLKISCTMHEPSHRIILRPVTSERYCPRWRSGTKRISWSAGTRLMISSALPLVTIQSDSALTAAVLLMYVTVWKRRLLMRSISW
jgi:hypothetical protein